MRTWFATFLLTVAYCELLEEKSVWRVACTHLVLFSVPLEIAFSQKTQSIIKEFTD